MGIWQCLHSIDGITECAAILKSNPTVHSQIKYTNTLRTSNPAPQHIPWRNCPQAWEGRSLQHCLSWQEAGGTWEGHY